MAFQNNKQFNSPIGQQPSSQPGMGSPFAVSPMTAVSGAMFVHSPISQQSPIPSSLPGYLPLGQSSPVVPSQITTAMPPVPPMIPGPHMRLFPPTGQVTAGMNVPSVPWGAGAITGPTFIPPPGTTSMQPGMFGAVPPSIPFGQPPYVQPQMPHSQPLHQVSYSQSNQQNYSNVYGMTNQMPGNNQEVNKRRENDSHKQSERFQHSRHRDRNDEKREKFDKKSDRSNYSDRGCDFDRRDDERGNHSSRSLAKHGDWRKHGSHGKRDDRRHHSKDSSRDRSWSNDSRDSSSESHHQGHHRKRHAGHDHHRHHSKTSDEFNARNYRTHEKASSRPSDEYDARKYGNSERQSDEGDSHGSQRSGRSGSRHIEDRNTHSSERRSGSRLLDDRDVPGSQMLGRTGAVLLEDRDENVTVGRSGAVLLEDVDAESKSVVGKSGAILKEDRDSYSPETRDDHRYNQKGRGRAFHGNRRGQRGSRTFRDMKERGHDRRDHSRERSHTRDRSESRTRDNPKKRPRSEEKDFDESLDAGFNIEESEDDSGGVSSGYDKWKSAGENMKKIQMQQYLKMKEHSRYWDALEDVKNEDENVENPEEGPEEIPAWIRCSAADLYYTKDLTTGCSLGTQKTQALERKFENELVLMNEKAREKFPVHEETSQPCSKFLHFHDSDSDSSGSDSDDDVKNEIMEEWEIELKRKQEHPQRLHKEVWHNEPGMLNDGPLCRCSQKHRKTGIRHSVYPGEKPIPCCDPNSNNKDKLFHYRISMSPTSNILTKTPSIIFHDSHEYIFEGFSVFTHNKIPENMPLCKLLRFSMVYTIYTIDEAFPENFTVRSLDLFTRYLYTEILELLDLDWKGHQEEKSCQRFHLMPRFARPLPDNGKEILSMNEVLKYLIGSKMPLLDPLKLPQLLKLNRQEWTDFVDDFRGMIVTCPGMKPTSLRIDQLDKSHCEENDGGTVSFPVIVHCGMRPPQLSYCGDPEYKRKWREFMKLRHLYTNRPKITQDEKDKLNEASEELVQIRIGSNKKKDVTIEVSAEGFYRTGIRTDICQHALLLPVLFEHLRFHDCLHSFEEHIGYTFKDRYLLQLAFTHSSYKVNFGTNPDHVRNSLSNCGNRLVEFGDVRNNFKHTKKKGLTTLIKIMSTFGYKHEVKSEIPHNERLEFLGDAVIEFLSSIHLFFMFPYYDEGEMTTYRSALVQNKNLTVLAKKIHLEDFMLFAHGPDLCEELTMKHAMANCYEALMGAMMLDSGMLGGGLEEADKVFSRCLFDDPVLLDVWNTIPEHPLQAEEPDGDRHWIKDSPMLQKLLKFEERTGMKFRHIRLLARAFCQRNVGYNNLTYGNNQRLEFLGDTIIQLITSEYLYKHFPVHHEGHLTLLRSSLVNNKTQATVCEQLGMTEFVINDNPWDMRTTAHLRIKHKADLLEALLGAMYVDGGLEFPKTLVECCFFPGLEEFILNQDWNDPKSQLQQCCLVLRDPNDGDPEVPLYKIINVCGPSNTRCYTVAVYFRGERLATGTNYGIQSAEMEAAAKALIDHKDRFLLPLFQRSPWFGRQLKNSRLMKENSTQGLSQHWQKV